MIKEYQVTMFCSTGTYRPASCIIKSEEIDLTDKVAKKKLVNQGVQKICAKRYWTSRDLQKYNYTKAKIREYDKEAIAKENAARYEAIKEAHYADGSWKKPKSKTTQSNE